MGERGATGHPRAAWAFEPGARARDRQLGDATFWTRPIGELVAPTGRIVACDPFECVDAPAFAREVAPGRYPILLAVARFARAGDERIAAAMLRLRDAAPVHWELAAWERREGTAAGEEEEGWGEADGAPVGGAYCVDSGLGAFMDEAAIEALAGHIEAGDDEDYLERRLDALGPTGGAEWLDIPLDEKTGANMLLFTSGWGDGEYPSYWGYAADGGLVCLLTDFAVVDDVDLPQ